MGATASHQNSLDGSATSRAGLSISMSDLKVELSCAELALGANIGINSGALAIYS